MAAPKLAAPPTVSAETWHTLLKAAADFERLAPWDFAFDTHLVGLIDPVSGETRIGHALGNAGEVFAATIYRRSGLRWIISLLQEEEEEPDDIGSAEGMECLQAEFVSKREMGKEDLAVLKAAAYKPAGRGPVWPQFRSMEPGWHPWFISQAEAELLIADLPRMTAFYRMFEECPELYDRRSPAEIPFLPAILPDRSLEPGDLDWRPLLPPPEEPLEPYRPDAEVLNKLRAFKRVADCTCEFDCALLPGGSFVQDGRPCFGRLSLLVETRKGLVLGNGLQGASIPLGEAAGRGLVECLERAGTLPEKIAIGGSLLYDALRPLCEELRIEIQPVSSLPHLDEALDALAEHLSSGRF